MAHEWTPSFYEFVTGLISITAGGLVLFLWRNHLSHAGRERKRIDNKLDEHIRESKISHARMYTKLSEIEVALGRVETRVETLKK